MRFSVTDMSGLTECGTEEPKRQGLGSWWELLVVLKNCGMAIQFKDYDAANKRAARRMAKSIKAVSAKYDRRIGLVVVQTGGGVFLQFKPRDIRGLEHPRQATSRRSLSRHLVGLQCA